MMMWVQKVRRVKVDPPPLLHFLAMHYLYILRSGQDGKLYIGQTSDLQLRLKQHNSGKNISTKNRKPF